MNTNTAPNLEILSAEPTQRRHETPLLFVHGAFAAAWCWEEHFLPWFAQAGWSAHALSLRGHGRSEGGDMLDWWSIDNYVEDVLRVAGGFATPPVLIGHSMGGFVIQKCVERFQAPAVVLMASVPPTGLFASSVALAFARPDLMTDINRLLGGGDIASHVLRDTLFSQEVDDATLARHFVRMQRESQRAIWDMTLFNLPRHGVLDNTPLLILGAGEDRLIPLSQVEVTARTYGADAEIFPGMGHGMMLEREWASVARTIDTWLGAQKL